MKELSNQQVSQVSGGCFFSYLTNLVSKPLGQVVHGIETNLYDATLGKVPLLGPLLKGLVTDPLNVFKNPAAK